MPVKTYVIKRAADIASIPEDRRQQFAAALMQQFQDEKDVRVRIALRRLAMRAVNGQQALRFVGPKVPAYEVQWDDHGKP